MSVLRFFFSFDGRLSRGGYWLRSLAAMLLFFVIGVCLMAMVAVLLRNSTEISPLVFAPVIVVDFAVYVWALVAVACRRCHDLGVPGRAMLGFGVNSLQLSFRRGTAGPNAFGADPLEKVPA